MSTVMYAYRCKFENMWKVVAYLRKLAKASVIHNPTDYQLFSKSYYSLDYRQRNNLKEELEVELQFFMRGKELIFRILSQGYYFMNHLSHNPVPFIEPVFYDNRADVPPEQEKNAKIAEWLDGMIDNKKYFLIPVRTIEDILRGK